MLPTPACPTHPRCGRWFKYVTSPDSLLGAAGRKRLWLRFLVSAGPGLEEEAAAYGDLLAVDAPEGYEVELIQRAK